ncbi:MAG: hypothetical protein HY340_03820 [Candidatus Kerfeldbacteria bacterium]|nr:hypothetical protein [Candidatus Kerfeldbacteria bacterium]
MTVLDRLLPQSARRLLIATWLALVVVTIIVPVVSWLRRPPGSVFTGYSYESVGDIFVYLNFIEQAKNGAVLFTDMFTPEPHEPVLLHPLFLILGRVAAAVHASPLVVWHAARALLLFPLVVVVWHLVAQFVRGRSLRIFGFAAILLTGGIAMESPITSVFLGGLYSPKSLLSFLDTLVFVLLLLRLLQWQRVRSTGALLTGLALWQALLEPYPLFLWGCLAVTAVFVSFLFERNARRTLLSFVAIGVSLGVAIVVLAVMVLGSPILRAWSLNAEGQSSSVLFVVLFALPLGLLASLGIVARRRSLLTPPTRFLLVWLCVGLAVLWSPYPYAYRLIGYVQPVLALFAVFGAVALWQRHSRTLLWKALVLLFLGLALSDTVRHVGFNLTGDYNGTEDRYLTADEVRLFRWVRDATPADSLFLTSPSWDTLFAQQAYRRVYATLGWQTIRLMDRLREAIDVYSGRLAGADLQQFVETNGIAYIVVGRRERVSGTFRGFGRDGEPIGIEASFDFLSGEAPFLQRVYHSETIDVYQVKPQQHEVSPQPLES